MLGKTAGSLYWMARYLERSENNARLIEAGFRIALTRSNTAQAEWRSVLVTAGSDRRFKEAHGDYNSSRVVDFLLRDPANPSSIISVVKQARDNARTARTYLTREVWEAVNTSWMTLGALMKRQVREDDLPDVLAAIRQQSAQVRGAWTGTMLRNDGYNFARLGTFLERADNTARILDVKYFLLLPSVAHIGSSIDNVQWETILRSVSALTGKVLVVDDEAHIRKFVSLIVRTLGQPTVVEAPDGEAAVEAYTREQPDLVLLDVNMPRMDGLQTLQALKQQDPDCVVVMLTSLVNRQTVEECLRLGARGYLRKDTPRQEIAEQLRAIIADAFEAEPPPSSP